MRSKNPAPFGNYEPDKGAASGVARVAKGVLSIGKRYAPLPSPVAYSSSPLNDFCLGARGFYDATGLPVSFLGDTGRLYRLLKQEPVDVSRPGGYAADPDWQWSFGQYNNFIFAAARGVPLQYIELGGTGTFADVPGAPTAEVVFRIRTHLFACAGRTVNWSAFNDPLDWEPDFATQAGAVELGQERGIIVAGVGGEQGAIFQERGIVRVTYQGGDIPWIFDEVEGGRGACSPGSVSRWGTGAFVCAEDGFYFWDGLKIEPIGQDRVDLTFSRDLNYPYRGRVISAIDTVNKCWMVAYPAGSSVVCNRQLIYSWADNRWTHDDLDVQALFEMPRDGVNADDQEAIEALFGTANVDELTDVSVDSAAWRESRKSWVMVDTDRKVRVFTGPSRRAVVETGEFEPNPAQQTYLSEIWPVTDAEPGDVEITVYARQRLGEQPCFADSNGVNEYGCCELRAEGRFLRAEMAIRAGARWSEAHGIHWDGEPSGER